MEAVPASDGVAMSSSALGYDALRLRAGGDGGATICVAEAGKCKIAGGDAGAAAVMVENRWGEPVIVAAAAAVEASSETAEAASTAATASARLVAVGGGVVGRRS